MNNPSATEKSYQSGEITINTTLHIINKQLEKNCSFFNKYPEIIFLTRKFHLLILFIVTLNSQVKKLLLLEGALGCFHAYRDFRGGTIKQLRHGVFSTLVDVTPNVTLIHGGCKDYRL